MRYHRNKGGIYGAGIGLLGLLVTVAIILYLSSITTTSSVKTYNQAEKDIDKALEVGKEVSNQAYQANRDPSAKPSVTAQPAAPVQTGGTPVSPMAPGMVTPVTSDPPPAVPPAKKVTGNVPREMPDHGAGDMMKDMEGK